MNNTRFVEEYREKVTRLLALADDLAGAREYYTDMNVGGTLANGDIPQADNAPTAAEFIDAVAAIDTVIAAVRVTPIQRLRLRTGA